MASELDDVLRKLGEIENRLSNLENGKSEKKIISEERTEISEEGRLDSKELSKENGMVKVKRVPVCDHCNKQLIGNFSICKKCGRKLDEKCSIEFRKQVMCPDCLRGIYPLSRQGFKVLLAHTNDIRNHGDINRITGIPKKDVKEIVQFLLSSGYLESHITHGYSVSERGREALSAYSQIWGGTGDMLQLDEEIKRFVLEQ